MREGTRLLAVRREYAAEERANSIDGVSQRVVVALRAVVEFDSVSLDAGLTGVGFPRECGIVAQPFDLLLECFLLPQRGPATTERTLFEWLVLAVLRQFYLYLRPELVVLVVR